MVGKAWCQECVAAGHIAFTVTKQGKMNAGAQLTFPSYSRGAPDTGWYHHIQGGPSFIS